jgi:polysaccharide export outer membrane protein
MSVMQGMCFQESRWIMAVGMRAFGIAVAALALSGCNKTPPLQSSDAVAVVQPGELPAPFDAMLAGVDGYQIGPFDRIILDVYGFPDLSRREIEIDAAGRFSVPIAGEINAKGLTPAQAADLVRQRLQAAYVRDPKVAINLQETKSRYVTVEGQVTQPGNYPAFTDMTLMRTVASAKGLTEFAKIDDVVVFRTVGDKRMAALYNLGAIRRGVYNDPKIYPFDVVVVGNSPGRRLFRDFLSAAPLLVSPLVAVLDQNN